MISPFLVFNSIFFPNLIRTFFSSILGLMSPSPEVRVRPLWNRQAPLDEVVESSRKRRGCCLNKHHLSISSLPYLIGNHLENMKYLYSILHYWLLFHTFYHGNFIRNIILAYCAYRPHQFIFCISEFFNCLVISPISSFYQSPSTSLRIHH